MNRGIAVAGNIIVDIVKSVDSYPKLGMLANIRSLSPAIGGCVPNVAIDLKKMEPALPVKALGTVGKDAYGQLLLDGMTAQGIDVGGVAVTDAAPTSFTDVMSLDGGERTFFHARGANALFSPGDVDPGKLSCDLLHIGYILLLDSFDAEDPEYGTAMARFLHSVQKAGIKTSVDAVSDSSGDFPRKIIPALPYCDYVIINEIECCNIWGLEPRKPDGSLDVKTLRLAMEKTMGCGVAEKVIVHSKEAGIALSKDGRFTAVPSLRIPPAEIRGSVGAGDAYCAGCLYGIYTGLGDREMLEFASAAAACNLFAENAVDGIRSREQIIAVSQKYERQTLDLM